MNKLNSRKLSQQVFIPLAFFLKKTELVYLLFFFLMLSACTDNNKKLNNQTEERNLNSLVKLKIPWSEIRDKILVDSIATNLRFIRLESTSESFLVGIDKVMAYNDTYLIFDQNGEDAIYHFAGDGKYLKKFDKNAPGFKGKISIQDFDVDTKNKVLYVADVRNRLHAYDIESGIYQGRVISDELRLRNIAVKDSSIFIYSSGACGGYFCSDFYKVNFDFEIEFSDLPIRDDLKNINHYIPGNIKSDGSAVFVSTLFNDTIFQVIDSVLKPVYFVDFNENLIDVPTGGSRNLTQYIIKESLKGKTAGIENYFITKKYFYFTFLHNMSLYKAFYSVENESLLVSDKISSNDGVGFGFIVGAKPDEDVLISWIPSEPLYEANKRLKAEDLAELDTSSSFMKTLLETTEVDNPVLILVDLK